MTPERFASRGTSCRIYRYVNVYHQGQPFVIGQGLSPLPYLQATTLPTSGSRAVYLVQCSGWMSTVALIDGTPRQVACDGVDATALSSGGNWPANFLETGDAAHSSTTDGCIDYCQRV